MSGTKSSAADLMTGLLEMLAPVTVVTGFEKGSGKTTALRLALPAARAHGPVGVFTIGLEGGPSRSAAKPTTELSHDHPDRARRTVQFAPSVTLEAGDVTVTTEALARSAGSRLEILDVLPGRSALGRLVLGRAVRGGSVALVGPEHLRTLRTVIDQVRADGGVGRVLVDSAVSRVTQVSALDAAFLHTARVDAGNVMATTKRLRVLEALANLPVEPRPGADVVRVEGPLTPAVLAGLGPRVRALSLADLTQNFLEPDALLRLLDRTRVTVRRRLDLRGIIVSLRGVTRQRFAGALGHDPGRRYLLDPWAVAT